jgi:cobalt/nickel transport system permease protein
MHIDALDSYRPGDSPIHRLDPRVKLVLAGSLMLSAAMIPDQSWLAFAALDLLLLLAALCSGVSLGLVQKRSAVALPFTLAALMVIFSTPGSPLVELPLPGGPWVATDAGVLRFLSIVLRSYLSVQAAVLLAATTLFPDLLWGMRALRVPRVMVSIAGFLYRYLFVLADEAQRLMRAREARSGALAGRGGGTLRWRARVTGSMAGSLFIRSYERSERIYSAMLERGYDGEVRTLSHPVLRRAHLVFGLVVGLFLAVVVVVARLGAAGLGIGGAG